MKYLKLYETFNIGKYLTLITDFFIKHEEKSVEKKNLINFTFL